MRSGRMTHAVGLGTIAAMAALVSLPTGSMAAGGRYARTVVLSQGTVIPVRMNEGLNSKTTRKGDSFVATVSNSVRLNNTSVLPAGTRIHGVVRAAQAHSGKRPGMLDLGFTSATVPSGRTYSMDGSLIGLDSKSVTHYSDGRIVATKSHSTNRLAIVGYGAGAGLILSALFDRRNIIRDVLIGGAAGYGAGALIKGKPSDVSIKSGALVGVRLDRKLALAY